MIIKYQEYYISAISTFQSNKAPCRTFSLLHDEDLMQFVALLLLYQLGLVSHHISCLHAIYQLHISETHYQFFFEIHCVQIDYSNRSSTGSQLVWLLVKIDAVLQILFIASPFIFFYFLFFYPW